MCPFFRETLNLLVDTTLQASIASGLPTRIGKEMHLPVDSQLLLRGALQLSLNASPRLSFAQLFASLDAPLSITMVWLSPNCKAIRLVWLMCHGYLMI